MKKMTSFFKTRFATLRSDEAGMETMEVIVILAVVLVVLVPVVVMIVSAISKRGTAVNGCIAGTTAGC